MTPLAPQHVADSTDRALLGVLAAALRVSSESDELWPGYDPASRSLLAYRPGGWAVLVNPPAPDPPGWAPYPEEWPPLSPPALVKRDGVDGLVGQLSFGHQVPGGRTVAVPLYDSIPAELGPRDRYLYAFLAHESFHQYQREAFSDVDTPSEESYPILDVENNARAALEMRALERAVSALDRGDTSQARRRGEEAVAIHAVRWRALNDAGRAIERAKEVVEGTAKYVETRAVDRLARRCRTASQDVPRELCRGFRAMTAARWIGEDFSRRLEDGTLSPRDMPRNRIYAVGAALGLLLDAFDPGWKSRVERAGTTRSLFDRLEGALAPLSRGRKALLRTARKDHGWEALLARSRERVRSYLDGFRDALSAFRARSGLPVVVEIPARGLSRSRSSREPRWVVDEGRRVLGRFVTYVLRRRPEPGFRLAVKERWVLDEAPGEGLKRVTFYLEESPGLRLDGEAVTAGSLERRSFHGLELESRGAELETELAGTVVREDGTLRIRIRER